MLGFGVLGEGLRLYLPLVSRKWKNGSNSSYNRTPFLHSLLTKGKNQDNWALGHFIFSLIGLKRVLSTNIFQKL